MLFIISTLSCRSLLAATGTSW